MSFSAVGQVFDIQAFRAHLDALDLSWASSVTIHHTAYPNLEMRPKGWTIQHMRNLANYYGNERRWSAGPHLFTDEDQIFGLSPLTARGVHAKSFNARSIGIEALGNYDQEDPSEGRGKEVWETTAAAVACLLNRMKLAATGDTIKFHRDDPHTSKSCPGNRVIKQVFVDAVKGKLTALRSAPDPSDRAGAVDDLDPAAGPIPEVRALLTQALAKLG